MYRKTKKMRHIRRHTRKQLGGGRTVDLVISRYKEPVNWLNVYKHKGFHKIHIYNKSDRNITCPVDHCVVHNIPNVGVCDHTYLYHIVHSYDRLADVTIFAPGSADFEHKAEIIEFTIDKAFETKNTVMNTYKFDTEVSEAMYNFTMPTYPTAYGHNKDGETGRSEQYLADVRPFGEWYKHNFPGVQVNDATFFGIMAISKEHIHQHPKAFYEKLLRQVDKDKFHEASHFMERSYQAMVHPLPPECIYSPPIFEKKIGVDQGAYRIMRRQLGGSKPKFAVMAQFKNEAMTIKEWVEHYKWQGVDEILLLDNASTDGGADLVQGMEHVTILDAPEQSIQVKNYNEIGYPWLKANNVDILLIVDLDEFMFATEKGVTLKDRVLEIFTAPDRPSIIDFVWMNFGSNGFVKQPTSIRKSFTKRFNKDVEKDRSTDDNVKSIMWLPDIREGELHIHRQDVKRPITFINSPPGIQLNHYILQSKEFFENVKMTRGAADRVDNPRDWEYFESVDKEINDNSVIDTKLKDLVEAAEREGVTTPTPEATYP
jgi:hypothetical protein